MYKLCDCVLTGLVYAKTGICGVRLSRSSSFLVWNAQKNVQNYSWTEQFLQDVSVRVIAGCFHISCWSKKTNK